jgi:lipopolysaccharide biosynthesis glycosyltransferase
MIFLQNSDAIFDYDIDDDEIAAGSGCTCNILNNIKLPTLIDKCPFNNAKEINAKESNAKDINIYINAGLILVKPNLNIYKKLLHANYTYPLAEQDAFNIIFKNKIKVLDSKYSYINNLELAHASYVCDIHIYHFVYGKPWTHTNRITKKYDDIYELWKKYKNMIVI